jgi:mRNA interferase RelE/StbE
MERSGSLNDIKGVKAMKGHTGFYRVRIGDYRAGFEITENNEILLILIAHRKDIYKRFPK